MNQFDDIQSNICVFMTKKSDQRLKLAGSYEKWISDFGNLREGKQSLDG